jgi:uridine kinase
MKGDVLIISDHHRKAAQQAFTIIEKNIRDAAGKISITVAGESGAGKSEIAASLAEELEKAGFSTYIFQQDDYFVFPPKSNAEERKKDIGHVGTSEVKLGLLDEHIGKAKKGKEKITKPLVIFDEDKITTEELDPSGFDVFIAEGTYTTLLDNADFRIFIDRNINDTKESRLKRNREKQDEFLEQILEIEHNIISKHKSLADIIITKDYEAAKNE